MGTLSTAKAPQDDVQQATGVNVSAIIFCALDRAVHPDCDRHGDADCNLVQHDRLGCQSALMQGCTSMDLGACPDIVRHEHQHGNRVGAALIHCKKPKHDQTM